ncbi:MAG: hypothetical protein U9R25_09680 [Chloroflexota bacterium]|nr:hypothetical protein [Chloroflexota bacterium]
MSREKPHSKADHETQEIEKERGGWLSAILILIAIQGVFSSILMFSLRKNPGEPAAPWLWAAIVLLALADIVAVLGMWNWKKWGLYLYAVSIIAGIAIGLVVYRTQLIVFHDIVLPAILAYILTRGDKWDYFE